MRKVWLVLLVALVLLTSLLSSATYVKDGKIVTIRSQFHQEPISVDGNLNEDVWQRAGSIELIFDENFTMTVKFSNTESFLVIGVVTTDTEEFANDSVMISFDVDGDGKLTTPEDAKIVQKSNGWNGEDLHWDGSNWVPDLSQSGEDSEFEAGTTNTVTGITHEFRISLTSENIQYDGFRIPNPSNTYIGFNIEAVDQDGNFTKSYQFPTIPSNGSGYLDLKLAGPEDQDLPEFTQPSGHSPPTSAIDNSIIEESAAGFDFYLSTTLFVLGMTTILILRRHNNE